MEKSINYSKPMTGNEGRECSEKTCSNCFENRGCMYDHYSMAKTPDAEMTGQEMQSGYGIA